MPPPTKIGFLRDEFLRIGCTNPADIFLPRLDVYWDYSQICVRGIKRIENFTYESLCDVLSVIPDGAGEEAFWRKVDATDFDALYEQRLKKLKEEWAKEDRKTKRQKKRALPKGRIKKRAR